MGTVYYIVDLDRREALCLNKWHYLDGATSPGGDTLRSTPHPSRLPDAEPTHFGYVRNALANAILDGTPVPDDVVTRLVAFVRDAVKPVLWDDSAALCPPWEREAGSPVAGWTVIDWTTGELVT